MKTTKISYLISFGLAALSGPSFYNSTYAEFESQKTSIQDVVVLFFVIFLSVFLMTILISRNGSKTIPGTVRQGIARFYPGFLTMANSGSIFFTCLSLSSLLCGLFVGQVCYSFLLPLFIGSSLFISAIFVRRSD